MKSLAFIAFLALALSSPLTVSRDACAAAPDHTMIESGIVEQVSNCTCKGGCACATQNATAMCKARCSRK